MSRTGQVVDAILQNERRHAPIATSTLEKREKVSTVRMQAPCPPSASREKDHHTRNTFRERKFKGEYYGSTLSSEGNSSRKRGEYTEKRSNRETITVDFPSSALRPITVSDVEFEFEETLSSDEDYEVKNNIQERTQTRKDIAFPHTTQLTIRKQANSSVEFDCNMQRTVCKVTQYCDLNKEKRALVPNPLDEFARRQLGCNLKLCRENLELTESFTTKTCKNSIKEIMINNWLIGIARGK